MKDSDRRRLRQKKKQVRQKGKAAVLEALKKLNEQRDVQVAPESFGHGAPCNTTT